jgi:ATP-dependent DNA helicase RecG
MLWFFEGTPDEYAIEAHMPRRYRNTTLVTAMTELNMIDHLGYGIERMNRSQASRYLPLPEYDLSNPGEVRLTIWGSVVDEAYTAMLMQRSDLPFDEVMALDRIQKGRPIADDMLRRLRRKGLVEGRKGHLRVAASVAESTGMKVPYLELRGQSDEYCMGVINDLLHSGGPSTRHDVDAAVFPLLSVSLTQE